MQKLEFKSKTQKLCTLALMLAMSLIIFTVEAQIPVPVAIPGVKLGLSNVITLFMLVKFEKKDAAAVLLLRVILGSVFVGQGVYFLYSIAGGALAFVAMAVFLTLSKCQNIWFAGVLGAIFHNVGQILVAIAIFESAYVGYYFVVLAFCSVITGVFTGVTAQAASSYRVK